MASSIQQIKVCGYHLHSHGTIDRTSSASNQVTTKNKFTATATTNTINGELKIHQFSNISNRLRLHLRTEAASNDSNSSTLSPVNELGLELQRLCDAGQLESAMDVLHKMDVQNIHVPSDDIYTKLLKVCRKQKALDHIIWLCSHLRNVAKDPENSIISESVISAFLTCHAFDEALQFFYQIPVRTPSCWNAIISGLVRCGQATQALKLYALMVEEGSQPLPYTFVSLIKACSITRDLEQGNSIREHAKDCGYESNVFISSSLVTMYSKCGSILDAEDVFGAMHHRCVVAWTSMMSTYVEHRQPVQALLVYRQMCEECVVLDDWIFANALQACYMLSRKEKPVLTRDQVQKKIMSLEIGRGLHADAQRKEFVSKVYVCNSLVCMYGRCGDISSAEYVFFSISEIHLVLWNSMMSVYVAQGQPVNALQLYTFMISKGKSPNERTFVIALQACSIYSEKEDAVFLQGSTTRVKSLEMGQALHTDIKRNGFDSNDFVISALLNMYGKCGNIIEAENLFRSISKCNLVIWNAMLSAYVEQGRCAEALKLYRRMESENVGYDDISLISVLQISGQTVNIKLCREAYMNIIFRGYDRKPLVVMNAIYAFGKCSSMMDAQSIFDSLPPSNAVPWNALIEGYAKIGDWEKCHLHFEKMNQMKVRPDCGTFLSILEACSNARLLDEGVGYFEAMSKDYGINPTAKHYTVMIELLGSAKEFTKVEEMLSRMPMKPDLSFWLCLLKVCVKHGNLKLGKKAFDLVMQLQPKEGAAYILMSKLYLDFDLEHLAAEVELRRQKAHATKKPSVCWLAYDQELVSFTEGVHQDDQEQWLLDFLREYKDLFKDEHKRIYAENILGYFQSDKKFDRSLCGHSQNMAVVYALKKSNFQRSIRLRKTTCMCRDCHELTKLISLEEQIEILIIDEKRCHHFSNGKCSCCDYL